VHIKEGLYLQCRPSLFAVEPQLEMPVSHRQAEYRVPRFQMYAGRGDAGVDAVSDVQQPGGEDAEIPRWESLELCRRTPQEEWVARCTAPGLKGYRAARRPYGSAMA